MSRARDTRGDEITRHTPGGGSEAHCQLIPESSRMFLYRLDQHCQLLLRGIGLIQSLAAPYANLETRLACTPSASMLGRENSLHLSQVLRQET